MWDKWRVCKEKTDINIHQTEHQEKKKKKLLNSKGQLTGDTETHYLGKKNPKIIDKRLCITESSSHTPETNTASEINPTPK